MEIIFGFHFFMPRIKLFDENEVLTKAMNLFWKKGYAATSIQDLVSHLGINRASIYATYGDKEQLFKKSFQYYTKKNIEALTNFLESRPNIKEGFKELFDNSIAESIKDKDKKGCFVVNTTTELIPNNNSFTVAIENNKHLFEQIFYQYLKKGKENGQLTTTQDLKALAALLFILYNGLKVVSKIQSNEYELKKAVEVALLLIH